MFADASAQPAHALHRRGKSDLRLAGMVNAELGAGARVMGGPRRADHALGRHTANVEAIAAQEITLDQRDLRAQSSCAGGADQSRRTAADDHHVVLSCRCRIAPVRRMAVVDQPFVVGIVGKQHFIVGRGFVLRIEQRLTGRDTSFLLLFRLTQRFARDACHDHDHCDSRQQSDIFHNRLIKTGGSVGLAGQRVARRRADVDE